MSKLLNSPTHAPVQLQRVSRRRHAQLSAPFSLPRLFLLHPSIGGALLSQHPAAFEAAAAPWLRAQLGWSDAELADAALTDSFDQLCKFDPAAAQAALGWLCSDAGLSQQQAARLLVPPGSRLLAAAPAQQAAERARVVQLAREWGVGLGVAAAMALSQPPLSASGADMTGRLLATLRVSSSPGPQFCTHPEPSARPHTPGQFALHALSERVACVHVGKGQQAGSTSRAAAVNLRTDAPRRCRRPRRKLWA